MTNEDESSRLSSVDETEIATRRFVRHTFAKDHHQDELCPLSNGT